MHTVLDRDVPRVNAMLKRMTEHLEAYLRGGDESDRLLEILGASSNMRRGGDMDETGAANDSATAGSATADSTNDDITTTDSTTSTSAAPESGEQTPPEVTQ
jgi:hypothetical protein